MASPRGNGADQMATLVASDSLLGSVGEKIEEDRALETWVLNGLCGESLTLQCTEGDRELGLS